MAQQQAIVPEKPKSKDKRMLTLFIVMVFSLLLAMTSFIPNALIAIGFQCVLIFAQVVVVKNLLDSFYGDDDEE